MQFYKKKKKNTPFQKTIQIHLMILFQIKMFELSVKLYDFLIKLQTAPLSLGMFGKKECHSLTPDPEQEVSGRD